MKTHNYFLLIFVSLCLVFIVSSCSDDDDDTSSNCNLSCQNGGALIPGCSCACPEGFIGQECEFIDCTLTCENGGQVTSNCECDCISGWTGENCTECTPKVGFFDRGNYWISAGGVNLFNNLEYYLPDGYVLTGLGFTGSSTLVVYGREFFQDGTLGEQLEFRDGSNPTGPIAVSYIIPDNHVITGVGFGEFNGIYRLVVNYNEIRQKEDCDIEFGPELLYDNGTSASVSRWLKVSESNFNTKYHAFGGIGIRFDYSGSSDKQVETEIRELINQF